MCDSHFSHLVGNKNIAVKLANMIASKKIPQAFLFAGPSGVGKSSFAKAFATALFTAYGAPTSCKEKIEGHFHPDVRHLYPEGKSGVHSIDSLRDLSEQVYLPSYEAPWKVFIIHDADRMNHYSANALLKTFEEPAPRVLFILTGKSPLEFIPTILSRCLTIHFAPIDDNSMREYFSQSGKGQSADGFIKRARGSLKQAQALLQTGDEMRQILFEMLASKQYLDYSLLQKGVEKICQLIEQVKKNGEEVALKELLVVPQDQLTAMQKQIMESQIEGKGSLIVKEEVDKLLFYFLTWHRDIIAIQSGADHSLLYHVDYVSEMKNAVEGNKILKVEEVYKWVEEAGLCMARSMPLQIIIENLFLKLVR